MTNNTMQNKNKNKNNKGKKNPKKMQNKVGFDLELGFFYNPLDLGIEAIATSKALFAFFPFQNFVFIFFSS